MAGLFVFVGASGARDPSETRVVTIAAGPTPVTEGASAQFVVSRTGSTKEALNVLLDVAETGSMISGTAPTSIVLGEGEESKRLLVSTEQDDRNETDSGVTATVIAGTDAAYEVGSEFSATVIVQDDDDDSARPVVRFVAWPNLIPEGADAIYAFSRTDPTTEALTVSVEISETGSTIDGPVPTSVVFGVGVAQTRMTLRTVDDLVGEPDSVITVALVAGPGAPYALTSDSSVETTIADDDGLPQTVLPVITVEADETPVAEGESALFTIRRAGPAEESLDVSVEVTTTGSLALSRTVTLTMQPDNTVFSYGFLTGGDDRAEPDRTVTVEVMAPEDGSYEVGSPSSAMVVVEDDDDLEVRVTTAVLDANGVTVTEVPEDIGTATIRLTATSNGSVAPPTGFGVSVSTVGDSANSPDDYGVLSVMTAFAVADFVLDDTDNVYRAAKDVLLTIVDDTDDEDRETFTLKTERAPGRPEWLSFSDSRVELAIVDNDAIPGQPADLEATADGVAAIDLSWNAPDEAANPPITGYLIEWSPDGSSDWAELVDDTGSDATTYEDSGLTAGTTRHYRVSALNLVGTGPASDPASATTDPDLAIQVTTAVVDGNGVVVTEVPEHIGEVTVRVTATTNGSVAPTEAIGVAVSTHDDSAVSPDDYGVLSVEVPFAVAGWVFVDAEDHYSAVKDVLLAIVDDSLDEEDRETLGLVTEKSPGLPAYVSLPGRIELAIVDNDQPTYALSVDPASIGEAGGVATVKVSTGGVTLATDQEFELTLGGTATLDTDYTIDATTLTLDAGETEVAATITAVDDTEDDDAETVVVTASLDGATVGSAQTTTIDDDESVPDLEIQITTAVVDADGFAVTEVPEGIGAATIRVTASTGGSLPPTSDLDVAVSTRAGSAVSPDDYAPLSVEIGYAAADWVFVDAEGTYRAVKDISLAIVDDSLEEPEPETLGLVTERAPGTPAYVSFPPRLELAIVDNDSAPPNPVLPEVTIAARSTPVDEGSDAMFVLTRTGATTEALPVSVDVTETGSMISGTAPVSAVFEAEQATTVLAVPTVDDSLDEADSGVVATVTAGEGAAYEVGSDSSATVVVRDNDSVPGEPTNLVATAAGQAAIDLTWAEPGDTGTSAIAGYRIERSADGTSGWTELVGDTGSSATEYRDDSLEPGATHYYRVFAMNFAGTGPPSNVANAVTASDPPEPEPPGPSDPPEVTIKPATGPVDEGTEAMFFLSRTGGAAEALTVSVEVVETGSMISGTAPTTAIFAEGTEETTFTVPTADDVVDEPASVITATVTAGEDAAYSVGTASSVAVTVNDNDAVPGAPDSLAATADGEAAIHLLWAPPGDPGSSAITGYRVEWSTDGSSGWKELVADSDSTETAYRDNGLEPGTTRYYRVCAMNSTGPGPVSNVAGAMTSLPLPEVTITAAESAVDEGAAVTFVLSRTGAAAELLAVSLEATETGSTIGGAPPASALFPAGAAEMTLSIVTEDDSLDEPDREITVTLLDGDGYTLGDDISATVQVKDNDATPVLAITDASAPEGAGEIVFTVTLSGESAMPATVRWASSAATAQPGLDYIEASGELTFAPGTTSQRLAVPVLEDLLVEEAETFRVSLSEATNAAFEAGSVVAATGTIEDDDDTAPAEGWLARFGRTAASNAVDAVEDRLTGRLGSGAQVVVAGHRIDVSAPGQDRGAAVSAAAPVAGLGGIGQAAGGAVGLAVPGGGLLDAQPGRYGSGRMDAGDLLARSSFQFSSDSHAGVHRWSVWGRGAATRFDGGEDTLSLDGEVVTGTVGADVERGRVLFGVAVSHSRGDGDYRRAGGGDLRAREGDLSSDLTTGLPYLRVAVNDRLSVWGALGRGSGSMTLSEGDLGSIETDIGMSLGAFGARRELRSSAATDGFSLALRTDLLLVHAMSDETAALPALSTDVNRLRLMIEGARRWQFESGAVLTPNVELGLRYDDGDAEKGGGMEVGAGLRFENAARGLSAELTGRSLLAHEASELSEWGVGGSLRFEPGGGDRGLSIGLRSTLGAASSGIVRLWEQQNAAPAGYRATAPGSTTEAEVGYGLAVLGSRGSLTPYLGAGLSERSGEAYKAGARLRVGEFFALDAEAARVERNGATPSLYRAALLANLRW